MPEKPGFDYQLVTKLELLKKQQFTAAGRARRIVESLKALNAPSPTKLTSSQWREIAEDEQISRSS